MEWSGKGQVLLCLCLCGAALGQYGGGSGWYDNPYLIYTAAQLNAIGSNPIDWDRCFKLMADIDLSDFRGTAFQRIGLSPTRPFAGSFDGNSHIISNFTYEDPSQDYVGLFYVGFHSGVANLGLVNVRVKGRSHVGGLAGLNNGTIGNCFVTGQVAGESNVGLLVGSSSEFGISNCYAIGSAAGDTRVGGLVGSSSDNITHCYAAVAISGREQVGGLIGRYNQGVLEGCYWDVDVSGQKRTAGGGIGRSTQQMMTGRTFLGWNKSDQAVWTLDEGRDYPRLAWEHKPGAPIPVYTLGDFLEGTGTPTDPYLVKTAEQLWTIGLFPSEWGKHFTLMNDIDLADCSEKQWNIIGSGFKGFLGVFDGNGHTISHLTYDSDSQIFVGLFGCVGPLWGGDYGWYRGVVKNLGVVDANVRGRRYVGALAGYNVGRIVNCFVTGSVSGTDRVGGAIGTNDSVIANSYSTAHTAAAQYVGGLVGDNEGTIINSYSTGPVSGSDPVGGLVGNGMEAVNSFWDIDTSGQAASVAGRGRTSAQMKQAQTYIGWNPHEAVSWVLDEGNDYPRLAWEGRGGTPIPPLELRDLVPGSGTADDPYRIATAQQFNAVGLFASEWNKCFRLTQDVDLSGVPAGDLNLIGVSDANAFAGVFDGNDHTLYGWAFQRPSVKYAGIFGSIGAKGQVAHLNIRAVNVAGLSCVGGLVGHLMGSASDCSVTGTVAGYMDVGGLVGMNEGEVSGCYAEVVADGNMVGGLIGANMEGRVFRSGAAGQVRGTGAVGGLAGFNVNLFGQGAALTECFAHASVTSIHEGPGVTEPYMRMASVGRTGAVARVQVAGLATLAGGMAGYNNAEISHCYATGPVSGTGAIGGLVGCNTGPVSYCYATGQVSGSTVSGGLVGASYAAVYVSNSFWDVQTTGQATSVGGQGMSTEQMRLARTYWGWNDGDRIVWSIEEGKDTPRLLWEDSPGAGMPGLGELLAGSGTADDPFRIATAADLVALLSFPDQWDKHFRATADLDLSGCTEISSHRAAVKVPQPFKGHLDGQGHILSGLVIDVNVADRVGLFGTLAREAVVEDLRLVDSRVTGRSNVGILAGVNMGSIRQCSASGTVSGNENVGVLVGSNEGSLSDCHAQGSAGGDKNVGGLVGLLSRGNLSHCYTLGSVTGNDSVGGLAGRFSEGSVSACYTAAAVSGESDVGGLIGTTEWASKMSDSYAQGAVSGTSEVGGLVGYNSGLVTGCYATGSCAGTANAGGLVGTGSGAVALSFWDIDTSGQAQSSSGTGCTTQQMKQAGTYIGWNTDGRSNWTLREGVDYPRLAWEDRAGEPMASVELADFLTGAGTAENPYVIATGDQLNAIGLFPPQWNSYFALAADIALSDNAAAHLNGIGVSAALPFNGVFDGQKHRITGLNIRATSTGYAGLFGCVGPAGHIKNLELADVDVVGGTGVGSLAGRNEGQLENCSASGRVSGRMNVGGLAGYNRGTIVRCGTAVTVTGESAVGGLAGWNEPGRITMSFAEGDVISAVHAGDGDSSGGDYLGGLVGGNGEEGIICYCFATGAVRARTSFEVGGLLGENHGTVSRCYARGSVEGTAHIGGLLGANEWSGLISECYSSGLVRGKYDAGGLVGMGAASNSFWDVQTSGCAWSDSGVASDTQRMEDPLTYMAAGWDFALADDGPDDIWVMPAAGGYPILWWELDPLPPLPAFAGGSGTFSDPYVINDANTLNHIGDNPRLMGRVFRLSADIDLQGTEMHVIGNPLEPFTGFFDGNGHVIRHLTCEMSDADHVGMFRNVGPQATIKNLGLVDVRIVGREYVGGLAADNEGDIAGCCVTGLVQGGYFTGGLVAHNLGLVSECYARASVQGVYFVGGLAGQNSARVVHCYAAGSVAGGAAVGGLVGGFGYTSDGLFWDVQVSGQAQSTGGTGKTTAEMWDVQTFQGGGWDFVGEQDGFSDIWQMPQGVGYPLLWWEAEPTTVPPSFAGGNGTPEDPYLIGEPAHLACIWANPRLMDKSFKLVQIIDMAGIAFHPIGAFGIPFDGTFDGNGFSIVGLSLDAAEIDYLGFFACIGRAGRVSNLALENVTVSGHNCVGALAGQNDGTVLGCRASGAVAGQFTVGGLIGWNRLGSLSGCSATATVSSEDGAPGQVVGLPDAMRWPGRRTKR